MSYGFHKNLSSTTVFTIDHNIKYKCINVSWAENQHIWMISEGSCDTQDWSNDAENLAYLLYKYFTILQFLLYFLSNK